MHIRDERARLAALARVTLRVSFDIILDIAAASEAQEPTGIPWDRPAAVGAIKVLILLVRDYTVVAEEAARGYQRRTLRWGRGGG